MPYTHPLVSILMNKLIVFIVLVFALSDLKGQNEYTELLNRKLNVSEFMEFDKVPESTRAKIFENIKNIEPIDSMFFTSIEVTSKGDFYIFRLEHLKTILTNAKDDSVYAQIQKTIKQYPDSLVSTEGMSLITGNLSGYDRTIFYNQHWDAVKVLKDQ